MGLWLLVLLVLGINMTGLFLMGMDKKRAIKNQYRIREATLWKVAFFGGALGALAGMKHYRHKTKHTQFKYGLPVLAAVEMGIFVYLFILVV